jgi:hypothetical protein
MRCLREAQGEHGDVVLLPKLLRGAGDLFGGLGADGGSALESEELAGGWVGGFWDAIGDEGELMA